MSNLSDFGPLDLTGLTDSWATVQAAVDNCDGLLLWPSRGTVLVDQPVNITRAIRIIGPGVDQWRTTANGPEGCASVLMTQNLTGPVLRINHSNVIVEGLAFQGTIPRYYADNGNAAIVVGDVLGQYQDGTITGVRLLNLSTMYHRVGVHWVRASDWIMNGCDVHGFQAVIVENRANVDKGAAVIRDCFLASDPTEGVCLVYKSGGALRVGGTYFLDSRDSMYIEWLSGLSGGPIITGCSFENMKRRGIFAVGNGVAPMNGMKISDCWFNGAAESIFVDDNLPLSRLHISGNTIIGGPTTILVNLGAMVNGYYVSGNLLDGSGGGYGIFRRAGSVGTVGVNHYQGLTVPVY